jgi:hypothetical protein
MFCAKPPNDWQTGGLRGRVKSYRLSTYPPIMDEGEWIPADTTYPGYIETSKYDRGGSLEEMVYQDKSADYYQRLVQGWDEERRSKIYTIYNQDAEIIVNQVFENLSAKGYKINSYSQEKEFENSVEGFFDRRGRIRKMTIIDRDGERRYQKLEYNRKGHLKSLLFMDSEKDTLFSARYEYLDFDAKGNWTKRLQYSLKEPDEPIQIHIRSYKYY